MPRVSALKVRVFATCKLRFRYQYVDKLRARLRPADTAGSLVHRVLCDFFTKVPPADRNAETLARLFEEGWTALSAGYHRVPGVEVHHEASLHQLANFARCFDLSARPLMVEPYFQEEVAPGVTLFGRLDRLDEEADRTLHVIDYKGGAQPEEIDPQQLRIYALLAARALERSVSKVSFWYLDDGTEWTEGLADGDCETTLAGVLAMVQAMDAVTTFPPTVGRHCAGCPYLYACEVRDEVAARREREGW
ncbi:MAG TPA: PD-(D/E)XK nuclease family protein [Dehalococcoidia bacterium]